MTHRPFGLPRHALLATALALFWFHPLSLDSFASPPAPPVGAPPRSAGILPAPVVGALLAAPVAPRSAGVPPALVGQAFSLSGTQINSLVILLALSEAEGSPDGLYRDEGSLCGSVTLPLCYSETLPLSHSATLPQAPAQTGAITEIRALFAEYIRLHAAKKMDEWRDKMFLSEAICVQSLNDGKVRVFQIADLAQLIAEEAKSLDEQREAFEDVRIEVYGNAAHYAATWRLFHNGKEAGKGRAFFSLVKKEGAWKIASLVWYRE